MLTSGCLETRISPSGSAASKPKNSDSASSLRVVTSPPKYSGKASQMTL
jgi:hypothetical protein